MVKVTRNYVEKYYEPNIKIFDSMKSMYIIDAISRNSISDFRELMISFLPMNSLLSSVFVVLFKMANDSEMETYRQRIPNEYILMSFLKLSDSSMKLFLKYYEQFTDAVEKCFKQKRKREKCTGGFFLFQYKLFIVLCNLRQLPLLSLS